MNINNSYFDGAYKEIWRNLLPPELAVKEAELIVNYFQLAPGSKVLDLMCGYGRHALELGRKGITVTAVDNLADYIDEVNRIAGEEKLPVTGICTDVLGYKGTEIVDLAICMGNSLNFFEEKDALSILKRVADQLKSGSHLLINTWSLAEIAIRSFAQRSWSQIGDKKILSENNYKFNPARIVNETTIISADGTIENKSGVDYIFTVDEMTRLLDTAGFTGVKFYHVPGKKEFQLGDPRAYIVAQKAKKADT
ncbi:MAG: class I SAM-dependent methyltransferase [Pedobacter sp.]|nr:MAG: class I SAM-dependent methyltransferase [Pedobacter sp.]